MYAIQADDSEKTQHYKYAAIVHTNDVNWKLSWETVPYQLMQWLLSDSST